MCIDFELKKKHEMKKTKKCTRAVPTRKNRKNRKKTRWPMTKNMSSRRYTASGGP